MNSNIEGDKNFRGFAYIIAGGMDKVDDVYWSYQTMESLKYHLKTALIDERYKDAAQIRDEINRRNGESKTETVKAKKA